jgi:hypothetical protein
MALMVYFWRYQSEQSVLGETNADLNSSVSSTEPKDQQINTTSCYFDGLCVRSCCQSCNISKTTRDYPIRQSSASLSLIGPRTLLVKLRVLNEKTYRPFRVESFICQRASLQIVFCYDDTMRVKLWWGATIAQSLKVDAFSEHGELPTNAGGYLDFIERFVMKINDPFTFYTSKVLVTALSGVEALRVA